MFTLQGKYNTAKVFTDKLDNASISQIIELLNQPFTKDAKVRIMPDAHAGAGCVIGFTANLGKKIIPNLVGVDIGCGMFTVELGKIILDLFKLDKVIYKNIPSGFSSRSETIVRLPDIDYLYCRDKIPQKTYNKQIGTLGGGNHFIELNRDAAGNAYLVIHSGSRNLGFQIAKYWQDVAIEDCKPWDIDAEREALISRLKALGQHKQIAKELKKFDKAAVNMHPLYPKDLCFLTGEHRENYLYDMEIAQKYAELNRETMARIILSRLGLNLNDFPSFHTMHNYINSEDNIIRKGAIAAYEGQKVLIPINMKDGSILGRGKGNPDWNFSAPHGAGRLMSRSQAKKELSLEEFKKSMSSVFTTSVGQSTLDEAPMAYKSLEDIVDNIQESVKILKIIKPIYNFKASGNDPYLDSER